MLNRTIWIVSLISILVLGVAGLYVWWVPSSSEPSSDAQRRGRATRYAQTLDSLEREYLELSARLSASDSGIKLQDQKLERARRHLNLATDALNRLDSGPPGNWSDHATALQEQISSAATLLTELRQSTTMGFTQ